MKIIGNIQGGGRKLLGHFKCHFESLISFKSIKRLNPKFATKVSFITVCKRSDFNTRSIFCRHQHCRRTVLLRNQIQIKRQWCISILEDKCDKTQVRPRDFLHPPPINSALYVVTMFVLVCLCRFLWQIILLTYMSYELVAHFDLSLDLFWGDFCISSHYS